MDATSPKRFIEGEDAWVRQGNPVHINAVFVNLHEPAVVQWIVPVNRKMPSREDLLIALIEQGLQNRREATENKIAVAVAPVLVTAKLFFKDIAKSGFEVANFIWPVERNAEFEFALGSALEFLERHWAYSDVIRGLLRHMISENYPVIFTVNGARPKEDIELIPERAEPRKNKGTALHRNSPSPCARVATKPIAIEKKDM